MTAETKPNRLFQISGILLFLTGGLFLAVFAQFAATGESPLATDGVGHYFVAFAACGLVFWGLALLRAARNAALRAALATPVVVALLLMAAYRLVAVFGIEDVFEAFSYVPAGEAVLFAGLAIAFFRGSGGE